jgi:hypothetical protein
MFRGLSVFRNWFLRNSIDPNEALLDEIGVVVRDSLIDLQLKTGLY